MSIPEEIKTLLGSWYYEVGQPSLRPSWRPLREKLAALQSTPRENLRTPAAPGANRTSPDADSSPHPGPPRTPAIPPGGRLAAGRAISLRADSQRLALFPSEEAKTSLLPLLQEGGIGASRALYLMARMNLSLSPKLIVEIMKVPGWQVHDLKNIDCLIAADDRVLAEYELLKYLPPPEKQILYESHRNQLFVLLKETGLRTSISPDSFSVAGAKGKDPTSLPAMVNQALKTFQPSPSAAVPLAVSPPTERAVPSAPDRPPEPHPVTEQSGEAPAPITPVTPLIPAFAEPRTIQASSDSSGTRPFLLLVGIGLLGALWTTVSFLGGKIPVETETAIPATALARNVPTYYTDAVTGQALTQEFLAADNDFQMGELFVARGEFRNHALSLFRDALSRYPRHVSAQYRIGFCLMNLSDFKGAGAALQKALALQPDLPGLNLCLGRIAAAENDWDKALRYYRTEFGLRKDLGTGLEYARFLVKLGRFPEAREVAATLEQKFPSNTSITALRAEILKEGRSSP